MRVQILLLGQFRVSVGDTVIPADAWRRERAAALVKRLALLARHRLHREQAMELFWPDLDPDAAGANLRKAIHFARRSLGEHDLLEVNGDIVALAPRAELVIDTEEFDAAAKAALSGQDGSECKRAADLYGGELLPDDRYVEWLEEPRQQLRERYARVLKAGKLWERLVTLDPTDEQAQCALMQAALDAGNRAEAIRLFQRLRELLRVELGVGPRAATIAIYERALATSGAAPVSPLDRIRASLAWGLVHLQSGDFAKAESIARETRSLALGAELGREVGRGQRAPRTGRAHAGPVAGSIPRGIHGVGSRCAEFRLEHLRRTPVLGRVLSLWAARSRGDAKRCAGTALSRGARGLGRWTGARAAVPGRDRALLGPAR